MERKYLLTLFKPTKVIGLRILIVVVIIIWCTLTAIPTLAKESDPSKITGKDVAIGLSTLVLQPLYLGFKLAVAITGTVISGATLIATGGDEEAAQKIFDASIQGPWGLPELYKLMDKQPS